MHYLIAADADWVIDEVRSALEGPGTTITVCRSGKAVGPAVADETPDLVVLDMQIGTMGAFAVTMDLHLEESGGRLPHVRALLLLDRRADVFLARRAGAEGWLIKPLDSLRLRRAAEALTGGGTYYEGLVTEADEVAASEAADLAPAGDGDPPEQDVATEDAPGEEALSG